MGKTTKKGYGLEHELKWYFRNQGIFAFRIPTRQQVGELAKLDVVICHPKYGTIFAQAKDVKGKKKKYFDPATRAGLLALATRYHGCVLKVWRDRGMKMEFLQSKTKFQPKTKITQFLPSGRHPKNIRRKYNKL